MMDGSQVSIKLDAITQQYPGADGETLLTVVKDISLEFDQPGINMLLGPSGCGKSTILRMMGGVRPIGVQTPTSGRVSIDNQNCDRAHDDAIMVFQRYSNRPDLTVYENIALPFRMKLWRQRFSDQQITEKIAHMLERVGLSDKVGLRPAQLSGGQNQRVALARALVLQPRILLMDEPFGALDAQTRGEMQELLVELYNERPCLIVFVTHDVTEALLLGDRVVVLSTQPAQVADDFNITEPRPRNTLWQRSQQAVELEERILDQLHNRVPGKSQLRISV